jgi:hypothetical protein
VTNALKNPQVYAAGTLRHLIAGMIGRRKVFDDYDARNFLLGGRVDFLDYGRSRSDAVYLNSFWYFP